MFRNKNYCFQMDASGGFADQATLHAGSASAFPEKHCHRKRPIGVDSGAADHRRTEGRKDRIRSGSRKKVQA